MSEHINNHQEFSPRNALELFQDSHFAELVADANTLLAATTSSEKSANDVELEDIDRAGIHKLSASELSELADDRLQEINTKFFGTDWLERPTQATSMQNDRSTSDSRLVLQKLNGEFMWITAAEFTDHQIIDRDEVSYVQDMPRRQVAVAIKVDGEIIAIPLDPKSLVRLDVYVPPEINSNRTLLGTLLNRSEALNHLKSTDTFRSMGLDDQKRQIGAIVDDINLSPMVSSLNYGGALVMSVRNGAGIDSIAAQSLQVIDTDESGLLALELANTTNGELSIIPTTEIIHIGPYMNNDEHDAALAEDYINVLNTVFADSSVRETISDAENSINNCEEWERKELLKGHLANLTEILPEEFYHNAISATGTIYYDKYPDEDQEHLVHTETEATIRGYIHDLSIKRIDNRWHVVLCIEIPADRTTESDGLNNSSAETRTVYVIPSTPSTRRLELFGDSSPIEDLDDIDLKQTAAECTEATREVMKSSQFKKVDFSQQKKLLNDAIRPLVKLVERATVASDDEQVVVLASKHYLVEFPDTSSFSEIAANNIVATDSPITEIVGYAAVVDIPELLEPRDGKLRNVNDLPLSHGQPMITVESSLGDVYYIPARDLEDLSVRRIDDTTE